MDKKSSRILIASILMLIAGCGLVLEDPRPYPPPTTDAALSLRAPDAGINERQMALLSQETGFTVSVDFGHDFIDTLDVLSDSTLTWLCESSGDAHDASLCWIVFGMQQ